MPTKKKRPARKSDKPPPQRRRRAGQRPGGGRSPVIRVPGPLQYKVVELSTVDEGALERTLNEWTGKGWNLDGVQFAMREASKRPAMAFVFFTREGAPAAHDEDAARAPPAHVGHGQPHGGARGRKGSGAGRVGRSAAAPAECP